MNNDKTKHCFLLAMDIIDQYRFEIRNHIDKDGFCDGSYFKGNLKILEKTT